MHAFAVANNTADTVSLCSNTAAVFGIIEQYNVDSSAVFTGNTARAAFFRYNIRRICRIVQIIFHHTGDTANTAAATDAARV